MIGKLPGMLFAGIALLILSLSGVILAMSGVVFNWVVIRTVFQFGTYFGTSEGMLVAWGIMRDIANIGLLFGFILMGVLLILNVDGGGHGHGGGISAKKAIPRLIIFAVLLNFSLFASQAVIDVANAFSASFATLAGEQCSEETSSGAGATGGQANADCANEGIAGSIMAVAGLNHIFDTESMKEGFDKLVGQPYSYTVSLIMLSLFVLITAMVLLAGAIMLVIRVVVLSLLMVTSPIGFAGMAIPKMQGIAGMWWSKLMSQAFFAPVYLLLIFISIKLSEGLLQGDATLANAIIANQGKSVAGNMQVVMVFMVVIGFMIGSLIAASKMGAMGAKFATQGAAALTVGSAGFVARRTYGAASGAVASRVASSSWYRNNGVGSRLAYNLANKGTTSSLSARTGLNSMTKGFGLDIGNAGKNVSHGLHGIEEAEVKKRLEVADKLNQNPAEKAEEARLKKAKTTTENSKAIELARWKQQRQAQEIEIEQVQAQNQTMSERRTDEIDALKGRSTDQARARADAITEQKRRIQDERESAKRGNVNAQVLAREEMQLRKMEDEDRQASDTERATLRSLEDNHRQASDIEKADIEARRQSIKEGSRLHEQNIAGFDARVKDIDRQVAGGEIFDPLTGRTTTYKGVSKDAIKRQYADALEHSGLSWPSIGAHVNHEAAEKIRTNANKTKIEKALDGIKEATEKTDKEKTDDHVAPGKEPPAGDGGHH